MHRIQIASWARIECGGKITSGNSSQELRSRAIGKAGAHRSAATNGEARVKYGEAGVV